MPVVSMPQNKTELHQTTPSTPNIPIQLLLAPDILRSHGQMHSIAISWIREDNLLLIPSLGHDDNNTIHLDFHIEIQQISFFVFFSVFPFS